MNTRLHMKLKFMHIQLYACVSLIFLVSVILCSGDSGSGKTYTSQILLRHLFEVASGGIESDIFKNLTAACTLLQSLGHCATPLNLQSSRIGVTVETHFTDSSPYRTKIHCHFTDQVSVSSIVTVEYWYKAYI